MHQLFMINQLKTNQIESVSLSRRLSEWFNIESNQSNSNETCVLNPTFERLVSSIELENFEFDYNYLETPITIAQRLQIKNVIYQSQSYDRVGQRRCNYAIRFKGDLKVNFGLINYFLVINGMHFLAVYEHTYEPDFFQVFKCVSSIKLNTQPTPEKLDLFRVSYLVRTRKTRYFSSFLLGTHPKNSIFFEYFYILKPFFLIFDYFKYNYRLIKMKISILI